MTETASSHPTEAPYIISHRAIGSIQSDRRYEVNATLAAMLSSGLSIELSKDALDLLLMITGLQQQRGAQMSPELCTVSLDKIGEWSQQTAVAVSDFLQSCEVSGVLPVEADGSTDIVEVTQPDLLPSDATGIYEDYANYILRPEFLDRLDALFTDEANEQLSVEIGVVDSHLAHTLTYSDYISYQVAASGDLDDTDITPQQYIQYLIHRAGQRLAQIDDYARQLQVMRITDRPSVDRARTVSQQLMALIYDGDVE